MKRLSYIINQHSLPPIPFRFLIYSHKKQDIEIAGFFAAVFAWGNRTTIIQKSKELMQLMDNSPYDFCLNHTPVQLKKLSAFKHRTFNTTDLLYFIEFFNFHYSKHKSLETAFTHAWKNSGANANWFSPLFFLFGTYS